MLLVMLALMAAAPPVAPADAPPSRQMQSLLENCDAHKFEMAVELTGPDGLPKRSRVKMCGTIGQSDADWVRTLKDAVVKTAANDKMPQAARDQIVAGVNAEIVRIESRAALARSSPLPPPRAVVQAAPLQGYGGLPPLPDTPPPPVHLLAGGTAGIPLLPRPKLSFSCFNSGGVADGPCTDFARDTMLTVRADEDLPAGTSLRFVLGGDARADVALAQLKRGRTVRFPLPSDVCSHIGGGTLEIRIVRAASAAGPKGQEVGTDGPYNLRC